MTTVTVEDYVAKLFEKYDQDKSGTLHAEDIRPAWEKLREKRPDLGLTEEGYQAWFDAIDGNGSGDLSQEDVVGYLKSINYEVPQPQ